MIKIKSQSFFLSHRAFGEKEVTCEEYIRAERDAGFFPKSGDRDALATGGFSCGDMSGRVQTEYDFSGSESA